MIFRLKNFQVYLIIEVFSFEMFFLFLIAFFCFLKRAMLKYFNCCLFPNKFKKHLSDCTCVKINLVLLWYVLHLLSPFLLNIKMCDFHYLLQKSDFVSA